MITAWPSTHLVRARAFAVPPLRVLAMAVLLFGVVFTHGPHAESGSGYVVTRATSATAPLYALSAGVHDTTATQVSSPHAETGEPQGDHGPAHQSEHCVSGQPQQGPVLTPPCFAASVSESAAAQASVKRGEGEPVISSASSAVLRLSVVRQV